MIKSIKAVLFKLFVHYPLPRLHPSFSVFVPIFFWNLVILGPIAISAYLDTPTTPMDQWEKRTLTGTVNKGHHKSEFLVDETRQIVNLTTTMHYILGGGKQVGFSRFEGRRVTADFVRMKVLFGRVWLVTSIRSEDGLSETFDYGVRNYSFKRLGFEFFLFSLLISGIVSVFINHFTKPANKRASNI